LIKLILLLTPPPFHSLSLDSPISVLPFHLWDCLGIYSDDLNITNLEVSALYDLTMENLEVSALDAPNNEASMENLLVSSLTLLDISTFFTTIKINHNILLNCLEFSYHQIIRFSQSSCHLPSKPSPDIHIHSRNIQFRTATNWSTTTCPQGTVLDPLLWTLYIFPFC